MDLTGKTMVVTGATTGIGRDTALALANRGASVVVVARDRDKAAALVGQLGTRCSAVIADLSRVAEVQRAAREIAAAHPTIDVLVNNAGGIFVTRTVTPEGLEYTFALNHMGYFVLTTELLPTLIASSARVVNLSSHAHFNAALDLDDLQSERSFFGMRAYSNSKLCNLLFSYELARRTAHTGLDVYAVHPGFVNSGFARNNGLLGRLFMALTRPFQRSATRGAQTVIYAATEPSLTGVSGKYLYDQRFVRSNDASYDEDLAARLWERSEAIVASLRPTTPETSPPDVG